MNSLTKSGESQPWGKLGFVGLGQMGRHIAANLLKSGLPLSVTASSDRAFAELEAKGASASLNRQAVFDADVLFLCLPGTEAVAGTVLGADGALARGKPGQVIVDFSTISYKAARDMAEAAKDVGRSFIDAPVSGMEAKAQSAELTIMCGGDPVLFEKVEPLLRMIGSSIFLMGPSGSGQLAKLINQVLFDINMAALAELLPMAVKLGLDPRQIGEIVNGGTGRSYASEFFVPNILAGRFDRGYPLQAAYKDIINASETAARLCIPLPVFAAAAATYQQALSMGLGAEDKGAMIKVFERALGVSFRQQEESSHG
jgi:3-hydroxyisobutyrate dehydrogenase-like beta-hydroxyacid dehydrogenase